VGGRDKPGHDEPSHPAAVAQRTEMFVDPEGDQHQLGRDAGEHDPGQHAGKARNRISKPAIGLTAIVPSAEIIPAKPNSTETTSTSQ
jgi:hypothetical protein